MDKQFKVVVTDYEYEDLRHEEAVFAGHSIEFVKGKARTEEEVIELCRDADGIINQYAPLNDRVLSQLERCKVISRYGVGVNTIDVDAATKKGIYVANVPDYCMDEVADHALALLFSFARKVVLLNERIKQGVWDYNLGKPIRRMGNQVLGVMGFGRIPRNLVAKAKAFGFHIVVYDPYVDAQIVRDSGAEPVSLEELFRQSDYVSVHTPLTKDTTGLVGRELLSIAKPNLVIINTSRGPVIDENALIDALQHGRIAGAALDVLEEEPIRPDHPFLGMDNVILTPHIAWYSEEAEAELRTKCARNVLDVLQGGKPSYLVNPQVQVK
jgi:D-3-phosphoglycerate dehydrogenase